MQQTFIQYIYLILIILLLVMAANRFKVAYPIVLVLGGLMLGFTDGFSRVQIDPELIFFIFLPPLLYEAAWQTSWKEFWRWRRVITSFAFPIVLVTSCVVAFVSSALLPGFTLALGFLLGGITAPPDAISATSVVKTVKVPKSLVSIIEGESLLNDASSLIVFRFALAAVVTGQFVFREAATSFFLVIVMGIVIGLAVGLIFYAIHRFLPTTSSMDIVLSFVTPYCMYYFAEEFHFSGVLAVVSGGLLLSNKQHKMLTHASRIQGATVWSTVGFVVNGIIFLLIGMQLPGIVAGLGDTSLGRAIWYGLLISLVLIVTRLLCTLGASLFTRMMSHIITVADPNPGWKGPLIFGWAGMRGVVSLAAALSIPIYLDDGQVFPQRNLILFITFVVILVTLVFQGLTLPWLIRKVNPEDRYQALPEAEQEQIIKNKIAAYSLRFLEEHYASEIVHNVHLANLRSRLKIELAHAPAGLPAADGSSHDAALAHRNISLALLEEQRRLLHKMNGRSEFDEDIIRRHLSLLDLEETKLRQQFGGEPE
ncbi:MAG TPA: Na+/H+ antiporter [Flavisolibacter sp.]|nr:Na+/H+ antiporter [Flavisolibacter sp.]